MRDLSALVRSLFVIIILIGFANNSYAGSSDTANKIAKPRTGQKESVILITIDGLRPDALTDGPDQKPFAPRLRQLSESGAVYENFFQSTPFALPNIASLLTGLYPPRHGVRTDTHFTLPERIETLPERLKKAGYSTAAILGVVTLSGSAGFDQGFDFYDSIPLDAQGLQKEFFPARLTASQVNAKVSKYLKGRTGSDPLFLWVHYADLIPPYISSAPRKDLKDPYGSAVKRVDQGVGELLDSLKALDYLRNALVIVAGTHPQNLGEHRQTGRGTALFDTDLETLLIVSDPAVVPAAHKVSGLIRGIDLAPTLLDLLALEPMPNTDGRSVAPVMRGQEIAGEASLYIESFVPTEMFGLLPLRGIRTVNQKLILDGKERSYWDLDADPLEVSDPAKGARSEKSMELAKQLKDVLKGFDTVPTEEAYRGASLKKPELQTLFRETTGIEPKETFLSGLKVEDQGSSFAEASRFYQELRSPGTKNGVKWAEDTQSRIAKVFAAQQDHLLLAQLYRLDPKKELSVLSELYFALQIDPLNLVTYGEIAREHERHKDTKGMSAIWRLAQAASPDSVLPYLNLAAIEMRTNGGGSISTLLAPLAEKQPWAASGILTFLSNQKLREKKWQESLPLLDAALKLNDKNLTARLGRAHAKLITGDREAAAQDLSVVHEWDPEVFRGVVLREAALFAFSPEIKEPEVAKELLDLLEKKDKDPALTLTVRAMREEMGGAKMKAAQTLKEILKIEKDPDKLKGIFNKIADLYVNSGKSSDAKEYYAKALEIDPYLSAAANNYAWIIGVEERNSAAGYLWVYRALSRDPQNPHILDTLAELYFLDGKTAFALQTERDALQIAPKDPVLLEHLKKYEGGAPEDLWGTPPKEKPVL